MFTANPVSKYNEGQADDASRIRIGDCFVEVNGRGRGNVQEMLTQLKGSGALRLRVARPNASKLDELLKWAKAAPMTYVAAPYRR